MKTQAPNSMPFLTERERHIAEQVRKLKDLQARHHVVGGNGHGLSSFPGASISKTEVKDSHDR